MKKIGHGEPFECCIGAARESRYNVLYQETLIIYI